MEQKNENVNVKKENVAETKRIVTYKGVYLGAEWAEGVSKTGHVYSFGKITFDFIAHKRDGSEYTSRVENTLDSKEQMPGEFIKKYQPVEVEYELPESPSGDLKFVRVVRNV